MYVHEYDEIQKSQNGVIAIIVYVVTAFNSTTYIWKVSTGMTSE